MCNSYLLTYLLTY